MAQYDRKILVPYLQDTCSAELLCTHLQKEISKKNNEIFSLNRIIDTKIIDPAYPEMPDYSGNAEAATGFSALLGIIGLFLFFSNGLLGLLKIVGIAALFFSALILFVGLSDLSEAKQREKHDFSERLNNYNRAIENNKRARAQKNEYLHSRAKLLEEVSQLSNHLADAKILRDKVYGVNIIPSKYRNVQAAYYLYDYFSTCRENDLDKIIQTLLLDEIVQKLDTVIEQNEELIINQRYQIALQEHHTEVIESNHREQLSRIAKMESNQELQADYLNMIETNQEVTNFFLASEYIQKYR